MSGPARMSALNQNRPLPFHHQIRLRSPNYYALILLLLLGFDDGTLPVDLKPLEWPLSLEIIAFLLPSSELYALAQLLCFDIGTTTGI